MAVVDEVVAVVEEVVAEEVTKERTENEKDHLIMEKDQRRRAETIET